MTRCTRVPRSPRSRPTLSQSAARWGGANRSRYSITAATVSMVRPAPEVCRESPAARLRSAAGGLLQLLDLDVAEVDLGAFGLEADHPLGQVALAGADLGAVDLAGDRAVVLAGDLGRVPLADGLGRLVLGRLVELVVAPLGHEEEQLAVVAVHALHLDALRPDAADRRVLRV